MSGADWGASIVDRALAPLPGEATSGVDLEHDNDFLELQRAAAGKPESQFGPGTPPDWRAVRQQSIDLFGRTRDLRAAVLYARAVVHLEGFAGLPAGLRLVRGLLEKFWDTLHPLPDDEGPWARLNALAILRTGDGLVGDLRQCVLCRVRGLGELRLRSVEVALGSTAPREGEQQLSREQLVQALRDAIELDPALAAVPSLALEEAQALVRTVSERFGAEHAAELKPLTTIVSQVASLAPQPAQQADIAQQPPLQSATEPTRPAGSKLSGGVLSKDDALRAIDMVCEYLERTEPANPAPLLLRRARRLINHNFLQLMKELAPDALPGVAGLMGVDPNTVQVD